jgi:hypothetical protein
MGHHADYAAQFLLSSDNSLNAGEGGGNMIDDIFLPAPVFLHQLLFCETVPFPAHVRKPKMAAAFHIFLQCDGGTGTELIQDIYKEGVIDSCFALNHSIVMIQYKAGIF